MGKEFIDFLQDELREQGLRLREQREPIYQDGLTKKELVERFKQLRHLQDREDLLRRYNQRVGNITKLSI